MLLDEARTSLPPLAEADGDTCCRRFAGAGDRGLTTDGPARTTGTMEVSAERVRLGVPAPEPIDLPDGTVCVAAELWASSERVIRGPSTPGSCAFGWIELIEPVRLRRRRNRPHPDAFMESSTSIFLRRAAPASTSAKRACVISARRGFVASGRKQSFYKPNVRKKQISN